MCYVVVMNFEFRISNVEFRMKNEELKKENRRTSVGSSF